LISDAKERTQSDDVRERGVAGNIWMYEGESSRRRAKVASRGLRLTEVYSNDETKEDGKITTCDTNMREGIWWRDILEELEVDGEVMSDTDLKCVGW
jgi:hypothetical protein